MRVCVATTGFPRHIGDGQCAFIWEAVQAIARKGVQIRVVAMHSPGLPTQEYMNGIEIIRPRYWWPERGEALRKEGAAGIPAAWRKYPLARIQIVPLMLAHMLTIAQVARSCDMIHAHWTLSAGAASLGYWFHRRPILATVHGSDIFQVAKHPIGAWLTRSVLRRCDYISAVSHALLKAPAFIGINPNKTRMISNGVDIKRFTPVFQERENLVLYIGSFIKRKGVRYLIEAMGTVLNSIAECRLVLIGDGPERTALESIAKRLHITDRIYFLGFQPQAEVIRWLQRAKLLVLPSLEEAQGVVLLEALACGTPIVASQVDGIPEVVTSDVGILAPPKDADALASAIDHILSKPDRWLEMSHNARKRAVEHYSWDLIADQFVELYKEVLGKRRKNENRN